MKKIIPTLVVLLVGCSVMAQYKKANIFGKEGRTYEFGTQVHVLGTGQGTRPGFVANFGRDQEGKRWFSYWGVEYIPSYKYNYQTTVSYSTQPVSVSGTTKGALVYALNYGFFLLKNDDASHGVKPFLFAGLDIALLGGIKEETKSPDNYYTAKETDWTDFNRGLNGGAGCVINLSEKLGIRLYGGYVKKFNFASDTDGEGFMLFGSHPYAAASLRFRIVSE